MIQCNFLGDTDQGSCTYNEGKIGSGSCQGHMACCKYQHLMHKSSSRPYMISPKLQLSNLASVFQMVIKESLGTTHVMDQWPV